MAQTADFDLQAPDWFSKGEMRILRDEASL
jgi:hypothetical protein